jgi:hypothetical protein
MKYPEKYANIVQEMGQPQVDALCSGKAVQVGPCAKTKKAMMCQVSSCDT